MLVHHLLTSLAVDNDRKIIKGFDHAPNLKSIHQKNGNRNVILAQLVQERILNIN